MRKDFGIRALLAVALPLMVSVACFSVTLFTDRTLLLWADPTASGASVAAGNLYWMFACVPVTALGFVTPLIARAASTNEPERFLSERLATLVAQTVWITLAAIPLFLILAGLADQLFVWSGHPSRLAEAEGAYFRLLLLVAPASMLEAGLSAYFVGRRQTAPVMRTNLFSAALNVGLDYWLIFGGGFVPALGIRGAAVATAIAMWVKVGIYAVLILSDPAFRAALRRAWRPRLVVIREILSPGSMLGLQQLVRTFAFSMILLAIGAASVSGLAASSAALSIYQLLAIPLIGLGSATTVLVAQTSRSSVRPKAAWPVRSALMVAAPYVAAIAAAFLLIPKFALGLSTGGMNAEEAAALMPLAVSILKYSALYAVAEGAMLVAAASLTGIGRTFRILASTASASLVCLIVGTQFGPEGARAVFWWWQILTAWAALQALLLSAALAWELFPSLRQSLSGRPVAQLP